MSLLTRVTPTNLTLEAETFLADPHHNPQLTYEEPVTVEELTQYGKPEAAYLDLAEAILNKAYAHRNEADLYALEGAYCDQEKVDNTIRGFLQLHKLDQRFQIQYSHSYLSRATINSTTIKIRLPIDFRQEGLIGALYHEVGTHALRRINYEEQPWFKRKKKFGFQSYLTTEEGLASLHALIAHSYKVAFVGALRYLAVHWAQTGSFLDVWKQLGAYVQDENRRWVIALRQKRGVADTSQPGGFTKDIVYFKGMVDVWRWLSTHSFNPSDLYWGKLHYEDVVRAKQLNPNFVPQLPSFFVSQPDWYAKQMELVGKENFFI